MHATIRCNKKLGAKLILVELYKGKPIIPQEEMQKLIEIMSHSMIQLQRLFVPALRFYERPGMMMASGLPCL